MLWKEKEKTKADLANLLAALELAEARLKLVTRSAWRLCLATRLGHDSIRPHDFL